MRDITEVKFYAGSKEERLPDFTSDFPYIATRVAMDRYPGRSAPWHWHGAVELSYTKQGCMEYHTPGGVHEKLPAPAGVPSAAGKQGVRHGDRTALRPGRRPKIPARGRPTLELKTYFEEKTGCSIYTLLPGAAERAKGSGGSCPSIIWTGQRPSPSGMGTTILKCSRPWAMASPWETLRPG